MPSTVGATHAFKGQRLYGCHRDSQGPGYNFPAKLVVVVARLFRGGAFCVVQRKWRAKQRVLLFSFCYSLGQETQ
jgi:hypothetical protein